MTARGALRAAREWGGDGLRSARVRRAASARESYWDFCDGPFGEVRGNRVERVGTA